MGDRKILALQRRAQVDICGRHRKTYREGKPVRIRLLKAAQTTRRRHSKIKSSANPFDPEWREYLEQRVLLKRSARHYFEYGLRFHLSEQAPVVKTGSAPAKL